MLTEAAIRNAKPREKPYKIFGERGLFMLVVPTGGRLWRFRYRHGGKEKLLSLGAYPDVALRRAREKRDEARRLVADGIDPSARRQADKAALSASSRRSRCGAYPIRRTVCAVRAHVYSDTRPGQGVLIT
jgi:hypothetical protein